MQALDGFLQSFDFFKYCCDSDLRLEMLQGLQHIRTEIDFFESELFRETAIQIICSRKYPAAILGFLEYDFAFVDKPRIVFRNISDPLLIRFMSSLLLHPFRQCRQ
ncbi:hypothetical protein BcFMB_02605 [Bifidobacterium choerinum]|uniref:Uncharacterized protein n=1 Tax=Bifidobacterium choerinum TaxID=35760 RepID=A0A2D3D3L8_9BIFI|nr:hypothetical protein BcFMB_02605 [Bifidobacterium choerinum]